MKLPGEREAYHEGCRDSPHRRAKQIPEQIADQSRLLGFNEIRPRSKSSGPKPRFRHGKGSRGQANKTAPKPDSFPIDRVAIQKYRGGTTGPDHRCRILTGW